MSNPNLLNAQQQRFVLAILEGKTQAQAYLDARFPSGGNNQTKLARNTAAKAGSEMAKQPIVAGALVRAQEAALSLASTNLASLVADLQEARSLAFQCDPPQVNAAVAATMGIAKLLGLAVDRAQVEVLHKPGFSSKALELSEEDWKRQFAGPLTGKTIGKR